MSAASNQNAFVEYWKTVWRGIYTSYAGLVLTGKYFFTRPVTMQYPEVRPPIPEGHRGLHCYDVTKCSACLQCAKICPVDCIDVEYEGKGKNVTIHAYKIDYTKCIFCNLCCEVCPTECLWMGADWDLSAYSREDCVVDVNQFDNTYMKGKKWPGMIQREKEKTAALEAKRKAAAEKKEEK